MDWKLKRVKRGKRVKGSYTVEAALISGIWLLVIFACLLLLLGSWGRVWDTAASCEIAVYGSGRAVCRSLDGVEAGRKKAQDMESEYHLSGSKREITVTFDKNLKIPFGNLEWRRTGIVKSKVIRPVLFIEKVQAARRFWETVSH